MGCLVKFWSHRWINRKNLIEIMGDIGILELEKYRPVRDYVLETGEWNWEAFAGKVNQSVLLAIASIRPPDE